MLGEEALTNRLTDFTAKRSAVWLEDKVVEKATSLLGLSKVKGAKERGETRLDLAKGQAVLGGLGLESVPARPTGVARGH